MTRKVFSVLLFLTLIAVVTPSASAIEIQLPKDGIIHSAGAIVLAVTDVADPANVQLHWEITFDPGGGTTFVDLLDGNYGPADTELDPGPVSVPYTYVFLNYRNADDVQVTCTDIDPGWPGLSTSPKTQIFTITPEEEANIVRENIILTADKYVTPTTSAQALAAVLRSVGVHSLIKTVQDIYAIYPNEPDDYNIYPDALTHEDLIDWTEFEGATPFSPPPDPDDPDIPDKCDFIYPYLPDTIENPSPPNIGNIFAYLADWNGEDMITTTECNYVTIHGNAIDVPPSWFIEQRESTAAGATAGVSGDEVSVVGTDLYYGLQGMDSLDIVFKVGRLSIRDFNSDQQALGCPAGDVLLDAASPHDTHGGSGSYQYADNTFECATLCATLSHAGHGGAQDGHAGHVFITSGGFWLAIVGSLDIDMDGDSDFTDTPGGAQGEFFCPNALYESVTLSSIAGEGGAYDFAGANDGDGWIPEALVGFSVRVRDGQGSKWFYTIKDNGRYSFIMEDDANYDESTFTGGALAANPGDSFFDVAAIGLNLVAGHVLYFKDKHLIFEVQNSIELDLVAPALEFDTTRIWVEAGRFDMRGASLPSLGIVAADSFVAVVDYSQDTGATPAAGPTGDNDGENSNQEEAIVGTDIFDIHFPTGNMQNLFQFEDTVSGIYRIVNTMDDGINMVKRQLEWVRQWYNYNDDGDFWTDANKGGWFANAGHAAPIDNWCALLPDHMSMIETFNTVDVGNYIQSLCNGQNISKFIDIYINGGVPGQYNEYPWAVGTDAAGLGAGAGADGIIDCVSSAASLPGFGFLYAYNETLLGPGGSETDDYYTILDVIPFRTGTGASQKLPIVITNDEETGDFSSIAQKNMTSGYYVGEALTGQVTGTGGTDGGGAIGFIGPCAYSNFAVPLEHTNKIKRGFFDLLGHQYLYRVPFYFARAYHRRAQYLGDVFTSGLKGYINSAGEGFDDIHQWTYLRMNLLGCPAMPIPMVRNWPEDKDEDHDVPALYVDPSGVDSTVNGDRVGMRDQDSDGVGDFNARDLPVYQVEDGCEVTAAIQVALKGAAMPDNVLFAIYDITHPYWTTTGTQNPVRPPDMKRPDGADQHTWLAAGVADGDVFDPNPPGGGIVFGDRYTSSLIPGPGVYMVRALVSDNESGTTQYIKEARFFLEVVNEPPTQTLNADYVPGGAADDGTGGLTAEILLVDDDEFKPLGLFYMQGFYTAMYSSPSIKGSYGYGFAGWYRRSIDYTMFGPQGTGYAEPPWVYATGTVTNVGTAVTGDVDTEWLISHQTGDIAVGDYLQFTGAGNVNWYKIASISSNTSLTLASVPAGNYAGVAYSVRMPFHRTWNGFASRSGIDRTLSDPLFTIDVNDDTPVGWVTGNRYFNSAGNYGLDGILGTADDEGYHGEVTSSILASFNAVGQSNTNMAVIWECGKASNIATSLELDLPAESSQESLTWQDQNRLKVFLAAGGKMFLSGVDICFDLNEYGTTVFLQDYLHCAYEVQDSGHAFVTGVQTDSLGNKFATINLSGLTGSNTNGPEKKPYEGWLAVRGGPDAITPSSTGTPFVRYADGDGTSYGTGGVKGYLGTSTSPATVFIPWAFEGIESQNGDKSGRNMFLKECYDWLRDPTATGNIALAVVPSVTSIAPGASWPLTAQGGSGSYTWAVETNSSGGSLSATSGTTVTWTAGINTGTDYVRLTDGADIVYAIIHVGILSPDFGISAGSTNLTYPETTTLTADGATSASVTWSITTNNSGGSINPTTGLVVTFYSGPTNGTDTIMAVDDLSGAQATIGITVSDVPPGDDDDDDPAAGDPPSSTGGGGGCFLQACKR